MHPSRLKPFFTICEYPLPDGGRTITQVFCRPDKSDLDAILAARKMGEVFKEDGSSSFRFPKMPSEHYYDGHLGKTMHACVWVGMVLNHANPEAARIAMFDTGIIHEISHQIENDYDTWGTTRHLEAKRWGRHSNKLAIWDRLRVFERLVPGLHPRYGLTPDEQVQWDAYEAERRAAVVEWQAAPSPHLSGYEGMVTGRMTGRLLPDLPAKMMKLKTADFAPTEARAMAAIYEQFAEANRKAVAESLSAYGNVEGFSEFKGLQTRYGKGAILMIDEASLIWPDDRLPEREPLPNQRQFEMSRVSRGQTAKEKWVAACVAKLKAKAEDAKTTAHKSQGVSLGLVEGSRASMKSVLEAFAGGPLLVGIDPAKPGLERSVYPRFRPLNSTTPEGFPRRDAPFVQRSAPTIELSATHARSMLDQFEALYRSSQEPVRALAMEEKVKGIVTLNGKVYPVSDVKVAYGRDETMVEAT